MLFRSSDNEGVVRVDENGNVTIAGVGTATITVKSVEAHFLLRLTCMTVSLTVPTSALSLQRFDQRIYFSTTGT